MRKSLIYATRFLALLALLGLAAFVARPAAERATPYVSALSGLVVAEAHAAPPGGCQYKSCPKEPGRKSSCIKTSNATSCTLNTSTGCQVNPC
jgi:hypothetical protein